MSSEKDYYSMTGYISNSSLNLINNPAKLYEFIVGALVEEKKDYFIFGTVFHMFVLEREEYEKKVKIVDYNVPRSPQQKSFCESFVNSSGKTDEKLLKAYREHYSTKESDDKVLEKAKSLKEQFKNYIKYLKLSKDYYVITKREENKINEMYMSIMAHKAAAPLFTDIVDPITDVTVHSETAFFWEDSDKIRFKSMVDRIMVDNDNKVIKVIDLKTTYNIDGFPDKFKDLGYGRQLAFYSMMIAKQGEEVLKLTHPIDEYRFEAIVVAVDKNTFEVKAFKFNESDMTPYVSELKQKIDIVKWHIKNDKWAHSKIYYEGDGYEKI